MEELAGVVHPGWCVLRHDGDVHRSRPFPVGDALMWVTCGGDWEPVLHVAGDPAVGPRLDAVTAFLLDPAGTGR